jgi:DNA-directed RNA polymerase specialized sigma24 family protein
MIITGHGSALLRQPDALLATLARRDSAAAFAAIVARYRSPLERHCTPLVSNSRADDVVQETFVRARHALAAGPEVRRLDAWLVGIAGRARRVRGRRVLTPRALYFLK